MARSCNNTISTKASKKLLSQSKTSENFSFALCSSTTDQHWIKLNYTLSYFLIGLHLYTFFLTHNLNNNTQSIYINAPLLWDPWIYTRNLGSPILDPSFWTSAWTCSLYSLKLNFLYTEGSQQLCITVSYDGQKKYAVENLSTSGLVTTRCCTLLYASLLHAYVRKLFTNSQTAKIKLAHTYILYIY